MEVVLSSSVERYLTTMRGNCVRCETTWALKCASPREGPWPRLPRQVPRSREPPSRPTGRCLPSSQQESCGSFRRALRCRRGSVRGGGDGMHGARLKAGGWCTRTLSMLLMVVTLDVSKLSFWLNADARCRVERRACDAGGGADREAGERGEVAAQAACTGKARLKAWGPGHARSARRRSRSDRYLGQRGSAESPCMTGPLGGLKYYYSPAQLCLGTFMAKR